MEYAANAPDATAFGVWYGKQTNTAFIFCVPSRYVPPSPISLGRCDCSWNYGIGGEDKDNIDFIDSGVNVDIAPGMSCDRILVS